MNILRVDSSFREDGSISRALADYFMTKCLNARPDDIVRRDVGIDAPPVPDNHFVAANMTPEAERNDAMRQALALSDALIAEIKHADRIVIGAPMYNFSVPGGLKNWIDHLVRLGETFAVNDAGEMVGLLEGKKALIISPRGAMSYAQDGAMSGYDHVLPYLHTVLTFMGISDITDVAVEGMNFAPPEIIDEHYKQAELQLEALANGW